MSSAPAVCFLLRYFTVGGLERVVISLANEYVRRGIDTRVVVLSSGKRNALITELDPRVQIALLSGSTVAKLAEARRLTEGRIVHVHFGDGYIHPSVRAALLDRQVVVTYHSNYRHKRSWLRNRCDQLWATRTRAIVAVSDAVKSFCVEDVGIAARRVTVIPNGIQITPAQADHPQQSRALRAISLSSLYPHKNHGVLIDGVSSARRAGADVELRLLGDGPTMAGLYERAVAQGVRDSIEWYGAVWRRDIVQPLLASSDLFVSASRFEGLPISVLEGMAHGLPMLLSDIAPHREAAGDAALYFPPDDPSALASALKRLASDGDLRSQLARASRQRVAKFDLQCCVDRHLEVYRAVAAS